jgi:FdhD protein
MRTYLHIRGGAAEELRGDVVREQPLVVHVNGERFLTLLCSPMKLRELVLGYLWMEKIIAGLDEVRACDVSVVDGRADVTLTHAVALPTERSSPRGVAAASPFASITVSSRVSPPPCACGRADHGAHEGPVRGCGALSAVARDPRRRTHRRRDTPRGGRGCRRHNAVDKLKGEALLCGMPTEDRILLSTGRVSSEMLLKAARMGVPIVASRTSPTEMAVALAEQLNITVCGYVRADSLNIYGGRGVVLDAAPGATAPGPPRRREPSARGRLDALDPPRPRRRRRSWPAVDGDRAPSHRDIHVAEGVAGASRVGVGPVENMKLP